MKTFGKEVTMKRAIGNIFGVYFKEGTDEFDWEGTWNKEVQPKVEDAMAKTVQNTDGTFTTAFWTSMMNSAEDFGETAKSMVMSIVADEEDMFEMIDVKTESDY
jgi:hypothetical protein